MMDSQRTTTPKVLLDYSIREPCSLQLPRYSMTPELLVFLLSDIGPGWCLLLPPSRASASSRCAFSTNFLLIYTEPWTWGRIDLPFFIWDCDAALHDDPAVLRVTLARPYPNRKWGVSLDVEKARYVSSIIQVSYLILYSWNASPPDSRSIAFGLGAFIFFWLFFLIFNF